MKFMSKVSTGDGRLTAGVVYSGSIVFKPTLLPSGSWQIQGELRIAVYDNKKEWMTFDPSVFALYDRP